MYAVLATRPVRTAFIALAFVLVTLSLFTPTFVHPAGTTVMGYPHSNAAVIGSLEPSYPAPGNAPLSYATVGRVLYVLGLLTVIGGAIAVGFSKLGGYLVTTGGAVLGTWGLWLQESDQAVYGAVLGVSVGINAIVLALVLEAIERATGRTLLGRRTIQTSFVVISVLAQTLLAAQLFASDTSYYG